MEFGGVLLATGLLWWGYHKISTGLLAPGNFAAFTASLFSIYGPLKHISNSNNQIQAGLAAAQRIFALLDVAPSVMEKPGALPLTGVAPEVVFKNVRFRYPGADSDALNGIMLTVRPGETVALVGPSGAGKTTLAGLLPRFYDVSEGAVEIGGRDVRDCTLNSLRGRMAIVTQETHLFNDSAANNIRYGRWDASREDIERAARDANAHGFIEALPEGYETPIGENGRLLSGGQRQRLAIARALIKDPDILILDEATSDLDARSEAAVQEALYRLLKGRTAFVIAHRLSTVLHASRIVVMEHGRITATGNHEELLRNNALYQELCRLQFMKESATALS
jgi:subfamily B ATP-binding cassette protein MsbA